MFGRHTGKSIAAVICAIVFAAMMLPSAAFAAESQVRVEDHAAVSTDAQEIRDLVIGDVDAPKAGKALDDTATVRSAEGESWDVPVLWIDQNFQLATTAAENGTYLPAIAFFVPEAYQVEATDGTYIVKLSEELAELYGTNEVVSVYDAATGITYILPAHLRDFFKPQVGPGTDDARATTAAADSSVEPANPGFETERSIIDIYCSQSARDKFTDEDLEWLLNLVINKLQPQAVNLLLEKFPAFAEAAAKGGIGKEIGFYVYCSTGDKDGLPEHEYVLAGALALVKGRAVPVGDSYHFGYMVGVDIASLAKKDENGEIITDPSTGKYILIRDGEDMKTFENTIVHEHFHALMFDYNRVGMTGSVKMSDFNVKPDGSFYSKEQGKNYFFTKLPTWFVEGSASSVENVYDFRKFSFIALRSKGDALQKSFDMPTLILNYVAGKTVDGTPFYYDLWYADGYDEDGTNIDNTNSAYVMGYLATLYLSELQARQNGKSAITGEEEKTFSSEVLRGGLNDILKRLHEGETLDEIIKSISPESDGKKAYNDTTEFQKKFIKGSFYTNGGKVENGDFFELGDYVDGKGSAPFVVDLLNYFERITGQQGRENTFANGSILFDFERDFGSPLNRNENAKSDYLNINGANYAIVSTVPDSTALKDGGKSRSGTPGHDSTMPAKEDKNPLYDIQTGPVPELVSANGNPGSLQAASIEEEPAQPDPTPAEGADDSAAEGVVEEAVDEMALPLAAKPEAGTVDIADTADASSAADTADTADGDSTVEPAAATQDPIDPVE